MERKVIGALVLVVVLVAGLVSARLLGAGITGRPSVAPPPPPPVVGDCVALVPAPVDPLSSFHGPHLGPVGPCDGHRIGEVLVVGTGDLDCQAAMDAELGLTAQGMLPGESLLGWLPYHSLIPLTIEPDPRQRAAGQRWIACAAVDVGQLGFDDTVDGVYRTPRPIDLGACTSSNWPWIDGVPCDQAHAAEWFGVSPVLQRSSLDLAALERTCTELVAAQLGRAGIGQAEGLGIVLREDSDTAGADIFGGGQSVTVVCGVEIVGKKPLVGTLRGVGDGALPLG